MSINDIAYLGASLVDGISDIAYRYRMGRPSLNMKATLVRFPDAVLKRIDAIVGTHQRAAFIRDAVIAELERRDKEAATEKPSV